MALFYIDACSRPRVCYIAVTRGRAQGRCIVKPCSVTVNKFTLRVRPKTVFRKCVGEEVVGEGGKGRTDMWGWSSVLFELLETTRY